MWKYDLVKRPEIDFGIAKRLAIKWIVAFSSVRAAWAWFPLSRSHRWAGQASKNHHLQFSTLHHSYGMVGWLRGISFHLSTKDHLPLGRKTPSTPAPRPHSFRSTSLDTQKRCSQSDNLGQQQPRRESYGMTRAQKLFRRESYQDLQYLRYENAISAMDFPTFWCDIAGTWISTSYIHIQVIYIYLLGSRNIVFDLPCRSLDMSHLQKCTTPPNKPNGQPRGTIWKEILEVNLCKLVYCIFEWYVFYTWSGIKVLVFSSKGVKQENVSAAKKSKRLAVHVPNLENSEIMPAIILQHHWAQIKWHYLSWYPLSLQFV